MLLLELQDDDHDLLWAFSVWAFVVACLILWSRYLQRRDSRIAAEAAGPVHLVREQVHRQRSEVADGDPAVAFNAAVAAAAAPAAPGAREDCPICLDTVTYPVDTNCAHTFCCKCFLSYHEQAGGLMRSIVRCPCCRRNVDMILPTEPGWTPAEQDSEEGRKLASDLAAYNRRFSNAPRSWGAMVQDTPHLLGRFWSELLSGGVDGSVMLRQIRMWILILSAVVYFLSPLDLIPEALFGLFGLIDDFLVLSVVGIMVAGVFRNVLTQRQAQMA